MADLNTPLFSVEAVKGAETKVKASTGVGGLSAALLTLAVYFLSKWNFVSDMPGAVQAALATVLVGLLTATGAFVAGFKARHTLRPDLTGAGPEGVAAN